GDEDEQPLNEMMQTIASSRNRNTDGTLARVVKALGKLREEPDSFGECEECGDEIPLGRLKAMPYAEFCVTCQGNKDGPKGPVRRKHLTDYDG
ncbi:MAG: TraR/DksA family transcriptional regulator, partial [Myxococcaceae bacterium]